MRISVPCACRFLVLVALATCLLVVANAGELDERSYIQNSVVMAYKARNFQFLETMAKRYRETGEKTSAGSWKLALFYGAFLQITKSNIKSRAYWDEQLEATSNWAKLFPNSPTPHIVHGLMLHGAAASYRGEGWANTVPKDNWEPYKEGARSALKYMLETKEIGSKDPHWYNTISNIYKSIGTDKKTYWATFSEGLDRYPYYDDNYFAAADFYSPRWYGSADEIESFARVAVGRTKDKLKNAMYTRIYWATPRHANGLPLFVSAPADWDLMKAGMDDVLQSYPDQWNINNFAYFSCMKGDMAKAKELIAKIKEPPIAEAWWGASNYYTCKERVLK